MGQSLWYSIWAAIMSLTDQAFLPPAHIARLPASRLAAKASSLVITNSAMDFSVLRLTEAQLEVYRGFRAILRCTLIGDIVQLFEINRGSF